MGGVRKGKLEGETGQKRGSPCSPTTCRAAALDNAPFPPEGNITCQNSSFWMFIPLLINFSFPWIAGAFPSSGTYDRRSEGWKFDQRFLKTSQRKDFLLSATAVEFEQRTEDTLSHLRPVGGSGSGSFQRVCFLPAVIC